VNITIAAVGAVDLVPTQKDLEATLMPHELVPYLREKEREVVRKNSNAASKL
jgi:23S rRNA maturation mini-RNase III